MLRLSTTSFVLSLIFGSYALHPLYASGPNASKSVHEMTEEEQLAQAIKNSQDTHQQGNERRARENRRQNETPSTPAITEEKQIEQAMANSIKTHEEGNKKRAREHWQDIKKILKSSKDINELLKFDEVQKCMNEFKILIQEIKQGYEKGRLGNMWHNQERDNIMLKGNEQLLIGTLSNHASRVFDRQPFSSDTEDKSLFKELIKILFDKIAYYNSNNLLVIK